MLREEDMHALDYLGYDRELSPWARWLSSDFSILHFLLDLDSRRRAPEM